MRLALNQLLQAIRSGAEFPDALHAAATTFKVNPEQLKNEYDRVTEGFATIRSEREAYLAELPKIREEGEKALRRLFEVAHNNSGQCRYIASFILGLYNGSRFRFDLTDLRCIDRGLFLDCMAVLDMDSNPFQEVHKYFENGGTRFEALAKYWDIKDYLTPQL